MSTIDQFLDRQPPDVLYHYTSLEGFKGIVEKKSIWATDIKFLNDITEFSHAISIAKERFIDLPDEADIQIFSTIFTATLDRMFSGELLTTCITSFSEEKDLLSQWRGYCSSSEGICFGLKSSSLVHLLGGTSASQLAPCEYAAEKQANLVSDALAGVAETMKSKAWKETVKKRALAWPSLIGANGTPDPAALDEFAEKVVEDFKAGASASASESAYRLFQIAALIKDGAFQEEKEWRLVVPCDPNEGKWRFRVARHALVPFIELPLVSKGAQLEFEEIIIGPTPEGELTRKSVERLLSSAKAKTKACRISAIPYRNW